MSLRNDPNYFPQPDVPTNGNYDSSFGKEQLYYNYLPRSADIDAANAAAGEKTYSSGKYVFNPATGQYTWVPASAATLAPTTPTTPVTTMESPAGGERGAGNDGSGGFPGSTMVDGISGPTTGLASLANSLAANLGTRSTQSTGLYSGALRGLSDAIARNVDPNYSHEGRPGRGASTVPGIAPAANPMSLDRAQLAEKDIQDRKAAAADAEAIGSDRFGNVNTGDGTDTGTSTNTGNTGMSTGATGGSPAQAGDIGGGGSYGGYDGGDPGGDGARANGGMIGSYAQGGLGSLGGYSDGGRLLRGPGDGVSDSIPATIGRKKQPARLADGEFVVPARIVSELGNGSTEAGARKLYAMLARIQAGRSKSMGKNRVAVNSRMDKNLPA